MVSLSIVAKNEDAQPNDPESIPLEADRLPVSAVLAGAGARGAYEAGALSVLLPVLDQENLRPTMFFGTSAGSINATLFASLAHLPADVAAKEAIERWASVTKQNVMRPALQSLPRVAINYAASLLGLPANVDALLDNGPLRDTLRKSDLINWNDLNNNVKNGVIETVGVVATEYSDGANGRSKMFYKTSGSVNPATDIEQAIDYVSTDLQGDHVLASSAIPAAFPPVRLNDGTDERWYMDGGVRLNAPLKPAITFGANTIIAIATDPPRFLPPPPGSAPATAPKLQDAVDQVVHGAMSDRMIEDLQNLYQVNDLVRSAKLQVPGLTLTNSSNRALRDIAVLFCGPQSVGDLGRVAANSLSVIGQGVDMFRNLDLLLMYWLLGSGPRTRPDLISYLLFEPEFIEEAIRLGQQHASGTLRCRPPSANHE